MVLNVEHVEEMEQKEEEVEDFVACGEMEPKQKKVTDQWNYFYVCFS